MDKTGLGLVGVISSLVAAPAASAGTMPPVATSYAELLAPIPNAAEWLRLANEQEAQRAQLTVVQYDEPRHHHHHHHHHHHSHVVVVTPVYRPHHVVHRVVHRIVHRAVAVVRRAPIHRRVVMTHHHHHHHHQHMVVVVPTPHHHHHHHHHNY